MTNWSGLVAGCGAVLLLGACGSSAMNVPDAIGGGLDGAAAADGPSAPLPDANITPADASGGDLDGPAGGYGPDVVLPDVAMLEIDGGEMADGSATAGQASGKFCHELNRDGAPVSLTLEIGDPTAVRLTAQTGHCSSPAGTLCPAIPAGQAPVRLFEGNNLLTSRTVILSDGGEYIFQAVITPLQVTIAGGATATGTCQNLDFPIPDAGRD